MASKVLVSMPAGPFSQMQVKKSLPSELGGAGGGGGGTPAGGGGGGAECALRVAHLEQSIRFLQDQHQLMLGGLHEEIESLRERNRDLQFQLIFNKESSSSKQHAAPNEERPDHSAKEAQEAARGEAAAARGEARAAEARALQLQQLLDAQTEKIRALELRERSGCASCGAGEGDGAEGEESPTELRARLVDAERLVRRLRTDADRQRRELACMKNSLAASMRAAAGPGGAADALAGRGYRPPHYHFPPLHRPDFWTEPLPEEFHMMNGRGRGRRPVTLPELQTNGHQIHQSTVYANHHTRQRPNGYENQHKNERKRGPNHHNVNNEAARAKSIDVPIEASTSQQGEYPPAPAPAIASRAPRKRNHHRKAASTDHT